LGVAAAGVVSALFCMSASFFAAPFVFASAIGSHFSFVGDAILLAIALA
jgi:hypothetical protein